MSSVGAVPATTSIRLNATNHGPAVILTAAIMLGISIMALAMRLYQRWPWTRLFKVEDGALIAAAALSIGMTTAAAIAVHAGLGQHSHALSAARVAATRAAVTATFATAFATQGVATISFALMLRSTNPDEHYKSAMLGLSAFTAAWALAGIVRFAVAGDAALPQPTLASWIAFAVISILNQLCLAGSALWMIWPLRMSVSRRLEVSFWFVLCIPFVIASTILRLVYTPTPDTFGKDYTWTDTTLVIILLVETNLTIASAACPSFRNLLSTVSTGFLVAETSRDFVSKSGGVSRNSAPGSGGSYGLTSLSKRVKARVSKVTTGSGSGSASRRRSFPGDGTTDQSQRHYRATVKRHSRGEGSFGSEAIMVRRSVEVDGVSESADDKDAARGS